MERRVSSCFAQYVAEAQTSKSSAVSALCDAGGELVRLLVDVINEADPCAPPHYNLVPAFFDAF
jgi:hypothetical protein